LPKTEVQRLTRSETARIYRALYWTACKASKLPPGVDLAVFDFAVNSGPDRAIRALQAELGVVVDGQVGPLTLGAAARANSRQLINALCDRRMGFLRGLKTFASFGRGWTSRVAAIRAAALGSAPALSNNPKGGTNMDVLSGYKTYIVAAIMLVVGLAQMLGFDLPVMEGTSPGNLMLEALAILFLRRGLKGDIGKA
jgi:lysozyme family protein